MQLVGLLDVPVGRRRRQHDDRDPGEVRVSLDIGEDVAPVQPGQVEVEQHDVGAGSVGVARLAAEERDGLLAVADDMELVSDPGAPQGFDGQADVAGVVLHQEDLNVVGHSGTCSLMTSASGSVKRRTLPLTAPASSQIRPPRRLTIL